MIVWYMIPIDALPHKHTLVGISISQRQLRRTRVRMLSLSSYETPWLKKIRRLFAMRSVIKQDRSVILNDEDLILASPRLLLRALNLLVHPTLPLRTRA